MDSIVILLGILLIGSLLLPWVNLIRFNSRENSIRELREEVAALRRALRERDRNPPVSAPPPPPMVEQPEPSKEVLQEPAHQTKERSVSAETKVPTKVIKPPPPPPPKPIFQFEANMGTKAAVWVGGVALLMAGFYLIKYSIETGLLTPAVRITAASVFGALLCGAGVRISRVSKLDHRIGQSLTGAGIAVLYFSVYAAHHFYHFFGQGLGFSLMIVVTVLAVSFSMLHGMPIAILGLAGGYLTPLLIGGESADTVSLFSYLFILFTGCQLIFAFRRWWLLNFLALLAAYLWVVFWLVRGVPDDAFFALNLFILSVTVVMIAVVDTVLRQMTEDESLPEGANYLGLAALSMGMVLSWVTVWNSGFEVVDWSLYGILAVAAIVLGWLREEEFRWAPVLAWLVTFGVLVSWEPPSVSTFWMMACGFTALFALAGNAAVLRKQGDVVWRLLAIWPLVLLFPMAYLRLEVVDAWIAPLPYFWLSMAAMVAFLLSLFAVLAARIRSWDNLNQSLQFPHYFIPAFYLLGIAACQELERESALLVIAGLGFVTAYLWYRRRWAYSEFLPLGCALGWLFLSYHSVWKLFGDTLQLFYNSEFRSSSEMDVTMTLSMYFLPLCVSVAWARAFRALGEDLLDRVVQVVALGFGFLATTALTRDVVGEGELLVYIYSVVWLLLGIAYLAWGVWQKLRLPRSVAFLVLTLTVLKVFFLDAAALTGLYRVLSFLGLGISMLLIAYGYNRFVRFNEEGEKAERS